MKKCIAILMFSMIQFLVLAQEPDPQLLQTWDVTEVIVNGESYFPTFVPFPIVTEFRDEAGEYHLETLGDDEIYDYTIVFDPVDPEFTIVDSLICVDKEYCVAGSCVLFMDLYKNIYAAYETTPMNYEINDLGNGDLQLIVTNIDGDQAIYTNYILGVTYLDATSVSIYPNPASNILFISSETDVFKKISIYDVNGQMVLQRFTEMSEVNVSELSAGLYFLEITFERGKTVRRFIKE